MNDGWVDVSDDTLEFTVHGRCDVDNDGEQAECVATKDGAVRLVTPEDVY